jgi:phage-related holin
VEIGTTITTMKIIWNAIAFIVSSILVYFGLEQESILSLTALIIIDYVTGIMKAKRIGESITSNKMKYGVASKLILLIIPITIAIGAKGIGIDLTQLIFISLWLLIFSEMYSILGNIVCYTKGTYLPEIDAASIIAKHIKGYFLRQSGEEK